MKKLILPLLTVVLTSTSAQGETSLGPAAIRIDQDSAFALCAANRAVNKMSNGKSKVQKLLWSGLKSKPGVQESAFLWFSVIKESGKEANYLMIFKSLDPQGWQLAQGPNGGTFPQTTRLAKIAQLVNKKTGMWVGKFSMETCVH